MLRTEAFDRTGLDPYHARAMGDPMLQRVPPEDLAGCEQTIEITWKVENFEGLVEIVEADLLALAEANRPQKWRQAPVDIRLHFGWADACPGIPALAGSVSTSVAAVCQRCLEPLRLELAVDLKLILLPAGVAAVAHEGYEVWELESDKVSPADIVEEALVMAMPFSVLHKPSDDCGRSSDNSQADRIDTVRPFGDLRSLMAEADEKN